MRDVIYGRPLEFQYTEITVTIFNVVEINLSLSNAYPQHKKIAAAARAINFGSFKDTSEAFSLKNPVQNR